MMSFHCILLFASISFLYSSFSKRDSFQFWVFSSANIQGSSKTTSIHSTKQEVEKIPLQSDRKVSSSFTMQ